MSFVGKEEGDGVDDGEERGEVKEKRDAWLERGAFKVGENAFD